LSGAIPKKGTLTPQSKKRTKRLTWKEAKELETIEEDIVRAEAEVKRIEAIFATPDFYEKQGKQTARLTEELAAAKEKVERLFARWHELEQSAMNNDQ